MPSNTSAAASVLHPTDFSVRGRVALEHAIAIALKTKRALTLLHVRDENDPSPGPSGVKHVLETQIRWRRLPAAAPPEAIQRYLGIEVTSLTIPGRNFRAAIIDHMEEHPRHLAVIATREHKGLSAWIDTSVERRALRRGSTPILFMREGQRGFVDPVNGDIKLRKALIPVDARPEADRPVRAIVEFIKGLSGGAEIAMLHVGDEAIANPAPSLPLRIRQGPAAETILNAAWRERADLIAMPAGGRHGLLDALRGSVSAHILDDARWPALSMPAD